MSARDGGAAGRAVLKAGACARPGGVAAIARAASAPHAKGPSCGGRAGDAAACASPAEDVARACAAKARDGLPPLFDMHCHLDFLPDDAAAAIARAACVRGIGALSCTVTPAGYDRARRLFGGCAGVHAGVGLHPWQVADGSAGEDAMAAFSDAAVRARFIGEVGLDFAPRREGSRECQVRAFALALDACACGGKTVSIHAVRSAGVVLDMLEARGTCEDNACILHWFSGTSEELARAVRLGCYFSAGPRMLATRRGRAYARSIPAGRLLAETDAPDEGAPYDIDAWAADVRAAIAALAQARGQDAGELGAAIALTSARLLGER